MFYPAAINDNRTIRIYYGTQYGHEEQDDFNENEEYINEEIKMFGRTKEDILSYPDSIIGSSMVVIEDDMLTVKEEAKHVIPYKVKGASFEKHPFFEGSSWYVFYHRLTHKSDYGRLVLRKYTLILTEILHRLK